MFGGKGDVLHFRDLLKVTELTQFHKSASFAHSDFRAATAYLA